MKVISQYEHHQILKTPHEHKQVRQQQTLSNLFLKITKKFHDSSFLYIHLLKITQTVSHDHKAF